MSPRKRHWLMKSEPGDFSIDDLQRVGTEPWTGVRNYQARNFMRQMQVGDGVLFYHSNAEVPGIYGIAEVASAPYPDPTPFRKNSKYYDPKATQEQPRWDLVDIKFVRKLGRAIPLEEIRTHSGTWFDPLVVELCLAVIREGFVFDDKSYKVALP